MSQNLQRMQNSATLNGKRLRPHSKTHKSIALAELQTSLGAAGICCAKLGEAEVMADAGISDIRLPYPLNPVNADRVLALLDRARISFIVDHRDVAHGWSDAMVRGGATVDVLVKVDVGFHRCGIDPDGSHAAAFVTEVAGLPGLRLRGLLSHAGHGYGASSSEEAEAIARSEGNILRRLADDVRAVGVGDRGDQRRRDTDRPIQRDGAGCHRVASRELHLLRSHPGWPGLRRMGRLCVDGAGARGDQHLRPTGSSSIVEVRRLTNDLARGFTSLPGYGAVLTSIDGVQEPDNGLVIERLSEEHANVKVEGQGTRLRPGDLVRVVPNHSCVVSNLVDSAWMVNQTDVLEPLRVSARGRIT